MYRSEALAVQERSAALKKDEPEASERAKILRTELRKLDDAAWFERRQVSLRVLKTVEVAQPCSARWEDMIGDDRRRHCLDCNKPVFDLSVLNSAEAANFVQANANACVRYFERFDGTIMTQDCEIGVRGLRLAVLDAWMTRGFVAAIVAIVLYVAGSLFLRPTVVSGRMGRPEPPMRTLPSSSTP